MLKFTVGKAEDLTDEQLINNIAVVKTGDFDRHGMVMSDEKLISLHKGVLFKRGYNEADIDIKVKDAMQNVTDINGGGGKFWGTTDKLIGTASDIGDVLGKFKGFFNKGGTVEEEEGSEYDITPGGDERTFNYKPYIIGGVLFFVLVGTLLVVLGKKK